MTMGNYSDALQRKDIGKMSLGFIPDLGPLTSEVLLKHLLENTPMRKTAAKDEIIRFKRYLEMTFWKVIFEPLRQYELSGVRMYILGHDEPRLVFPRLAYCVGDDPALHVFCGVKTGDRSCLHCEYNPKTDGLFNLERRTLRDADHMKTLYNLVESGMGKKYRGEPLLDVEREAIVKIFKLGLHYESNATFEGVPMGGFSANERNHVYRSPCDLLHTWECGVIKNLVLWTVSIVINISTLDPKYKFSKAILDERVASNKYWVKLPNVTTSYFSNGVCWISKDKTRKEKSNSTGNTPTLPT